MTQVETKKGTASVAVLLLLLVAASADSDGGFTFQTDGDMKEAPGCEWYKKSPNEGPLEKVPYDLSISDKDSPNSQQGLANCKQSCVDDTTCTHWVYMDSAEVDFWQCFGLSNTTNRYYAHAQDSFWDATISGCGFIPSRAPNQI